ncbi:Transmembrane protein 6/97 [Penicillium expansum]|nr:Transmembrane protein 6/97 [Penicillium expansum]
MTQHISTCPSAPVNGTWPISYFVTHVPIILLIDTVPLLPTFLQTNLSHQLREFYITTYRDKFFEDPPNMVHRLHLDGAAVPPPTLDMGSSGSQLTKFPIDLDHPLVPVHLLVFGVQAFITTMTSLVVVWSWTDRSVAEKQQLTMLYAPYMALGGLMALDMVFRLRDKLMPKSKRE